MGKKKPKNQIEEEFYNSMLYRNLGNAGGKIAQGIGKVVGEVANEVGRAVEEATREIGGKPKGGYNPVNPPEPPASYTPPPQSYGDGNYRYTPPKGGSAPPRYTPPAPPPPYAQPFQRAAPVPKPPKVKKKRYGGKRFLFTLGVAAVALVVISLTTVSGLTAFSAITALTIGGYFLSRVIFRERVKAAPAAPPPAPKPAPPTKEAPVRAKSNTGNPELDKIIDEGGAYITKLRASNEAILDEGISHSIDRMEKACTGIFEYVKDKPARIPEIKKFLNYYLPTTLKLLASYEKLSRQAVKGENISATMFDIEGMMQTIASAFEKQLDGLFSAEAMDIQADITVFDSILQQEGLKEEEQVK